ncbi:MAG: response regulator [Anaerolineales bacterium]|nr:response regulator [Anaerolineales bacterium]
MRVLLIDDESMYYKMMVKDLEKSGYQLEYARTGNEGLAAVTSKSPEVVIVDLQLPDMTGFEIIERLRTTADFGHISILVITGRHEIDNKLKAFSLGADDYLVKPFNLEELIARLGNLARRGNAIKYVRKLEADQDKKTTLISVHSLRGRVGCSTLAVNLGLALKQLWSRRTLIIDPVITAGQVAMMLNTSPRVTLESYANLPIADLDSNVADDLAILHKSGIYYAAASKLPIAMDTYSNEFWSKLLEKFIGQNEFIVADAPHDFSDNAIQLLNASTHILLLMAPELSSLRAASNALNIYDKLGFPETKVKIVLNMISNHSGIKQAQLEKALGFPISFTLPYDPEEVIRR